MARAGPEQTAETSFGWGWRALLGLVLVVFTWMYAQHPVGRFTRGGLIHGDGVYYYAYARSLLRDGDVDFRNDYALLGNPHARPVTATGLPENRFTIGPAVLWAPSFLVAEGVMRVGAAAGARVGPTDGSAPLQQRITLYASVLWGLAAIVLSALLARRFVSARLAGLAALAILLASPLPWYMLYQPSWPHAASAFAVAAFVYTWHSGLMTRGTRGWIALGLLAGLMALVRPQNVVFTLLPAYELGARLARSRGRGGERPRAVILGALAFAAALVLAFSPQMLAWWSLFGAPLTIPQGADFMRWGESRWAATLFSSRAGLFAWTPIVYVAIFGLVVAAWRGASRERVIDEEISTHVRSRVEPAELPEDAPEDAPERATTTTTITRVTTTVTPRAGTRGDPQARLTAALLLAAFALQCYVNGSVDDWWGGWAYGGRRYVGCTVVFVVGLGLALDRLGRAAGRRGAALGRGAAAVVLAGFAVCNVERMQDYFTGALQRGATQSMAEHNKRALARWVDRWYARVGHPGAAPASWLFALRSGAPPGRYDLVAGRELAVSRGYERGWDVLRLPDERWAMSGFGPEVTVAGQRCSMVTGTDAIAALPLRAPTELEVHALLRPTQPGARVHVELAGRDVLETPLAEGWQIYRFTVPARALTRGVNLLRVRQELPGPRASDSVALEIGTTGARSPVDIRVTSDATRGGAGARFEIGTQAPREVISRGVTAFVLERGDEAVGARALGTFDTHQIDGDAARFADAIARLPPGTVVALAFADKALLRWSHAATEALGSLGARGRLEAADERLSYALVGVKGAAPGTALERRSRRAAAFVEVGRPPHERAPAVCWAWLVVARAGVDPVLPEVPGRAQ